MRALCPLPPLLAHSSVVPLAEGSSKNGPSVAHGVWITTSTQPDTHNHSTSGACGTHLDEWGQQIPREDNRRQ